MGWSGVWAGSQPVLAAALAVPVATAQAEHARGLPALPATPPDAFRFEPACPLEARAGHVGLLPGALCAPPLVPASVALRARSSGRASAAERSGEASGPLSTRSASPGSRW